MYNLVQDLTARINKPDDCGTRDSQVRSLWDQGLSSPHRPTGANGLVAPFQVVLPVIHTLYVLQQEVL